MEPRSLLLLLSAELRLPRSRVSLLFSPASRGALRSEWGLLAKPRAAFCGGSKELRGSVCLLGEPQTRTVSPKRESRSLPSRQRARVVTSSPCPRDEGAIEKDSDRGKQSCQEEGGARSQTKWGRGVIAEARKHIGKRRGAPCRRSHTEREQAFLRGAAT